MKSGTASWENDLQREKDAVAEAEEVLARIADEEETLAADDNGDSDSEPAAREAAEACFAELTAAEAVPFADHRKRWLIFAPSVHSLKAQPNENAHASPTWKGSL